MDVLSNGYLRMFSICDKFCFEAVFLRIKSWHSTLIYAEKHLPAGTQCYIWEYLPLKNSKRRQWSSSRPHDEQGDLTLAFAGGEEVVYNVGTSQTRSCPALLCLYATDINHIDLGIMSPRRWFVPNVCRHQHADVNFLLVFCWNVVLEAEENCPSCY